MTDDLRGDKIIDSRAVIARLAELQDEHDTLAQALEEAEEALEEVRSQVDDETDEDGNIPAWVLSDLEAAQTDYDKAKKQMDEFYNSDAEDEREALDDLDSEGRTLDEWEYGVTLISESHFPDYARELASDYGFDARSWPGTCVDWEDAANELQIDYTVLDFASETYYVR